MANHIDYKCLLVLYCIVLYCIVLYCIVLWDSILKARVYVMFCHNIEGSCMVLIERFYSYICYSNYSLKSRIVLLSYKYMLVLYCIVLYCIALHCIVFYYEALYWRSIRPLSYRHFSWVVQFRTQPWLNEGSLTCDLCHHSGVDGHIL